MSISQEEIVLQHFSKYKYISSMEAFSKYGMTRLSAVIYNLRQRGYKIGIVWRTGLNQYGREVRWADYFLIKGIKKWLKH